MGYVFVIIERCFCDFFVNLHTVFNTYRFGHILVLCRLQCEVLLIIDKIFIIKQL